MYTKRIEYNMCHRRVIPHTCMQSLCVPHTCPRVKVKVEYGVNIRGHISTVQSGCGLSSTVTMANSAIPSKD